MKRKSIVIGSILKPVDDVRHYHKLALSMAKTNKYDINIIGFKSKNRATHPNIAFYPAFSFKRISPGRFFAPFRFLRFLLQLKPELVIVNTPELLMVTIAYKIFFGGYMVYDIQENYHLNILHLSPLPDILKRPAAGFIRSTELLAARWVDHFILAEKSYSTLSFVGTRWTILENKALTNPQPDKADRRQISTSAPLFLVSGTLSLQYGLAEAADAFGKLKTLLPGSRLLICGKTHDQDSQLFLNELMKSDDVVKFEGGMNGVSYEAIRRAIQAADAGLVFYPENPAISACFPTKIWEYMAAELPMLLQANRSWTNYCLEKKAGMVFENPDEDWVDRFRTNKFYPPGIQNRDIFWASEEVKLLALTEDLPDKKRL